MLMKLCLRLGESDAALRDYNQILKREPRHADALFFRGKEYERIGRIDDAIRDFSAVLSLDSSRVKALYARGACRNIQGDFEGANGTDIRQGSRESNMEFLRCQNPGHEVFDVRG